MPKGTCIFKSSPKSVLMGSRMKEDIVSLSLFFIPISLVVASKVMFFIKV